VIKAALPSYIPADVREDVTQESALAALSGEFDLSELALIISHCRRRINRLTSGRCKFISLDAPIPGVERVTYTEALAG
jgi:hypothetical protein